MPNQNDADAIFIENNAIAADSQSLYKELKSDKDSLQEKVRKLQKRVEVLAVKNGKQEIRVQFYRDTKWCRDGAVVALTALGLILPFVPKWLSGVCFCLVIVAATTYFWGMKFGRMDTDDMPDQSRIPRRSMPNSEISQEQIQ